MKIDKIWKPILHVALAEGSTWIVILFPVSSIVLLPVNCLILLLHPLLGFLIHLVLFSVLYTFVICFIRKKWAAGSIGAGGSGVVSRTTVNAMRWSAQNRRRWH